MVFILKIKTTYYHTIKLTYRFKWKAKNQTSAVVQPTIAAKIDGDNKKQSLKIRVHLNEINRSPKSLMTAAKKQVTLLIS